MVEEDLGIWKGIVRIGEGHGRLRRASKGCVVQGNVEKGQYGLVKVREGH